MTDPDIANAAPDAIIGNPIAERILTGARICFEKLGMKRTTLEDIAREAKVSRQTVYNHMGSKQNIIDQVTLAEIRLVQAEMTRRMKRYDNFADRLTEALVVSVRIAQENTHFRQIVEELSLSSRVSSVDSPIFRLQRERWAHMLRAAADRGELAADLHLDDIVLWLGLSQVMLLVKADHRLQQGERLRHFVRRYIVEPLLSQHAAASAPMVTAEPAPPSADMEELRRVVIDQALEISRLRRQLDEGAMAATASNLS